MGKWAEQLFYIRGFSYEYTRPITHDNHVILSTPEEGSERAVFNKLQKITIYGKHFHKKSEFMAFKGWFSVKASYI